MAVPTNSALHLREAVAEEIRALLGRRRLTGARLAQAIDRSEMYVSRRLRGETAFDLDDLEKIARVLGVSVTDLIPAATSTERPARVTSWYPTLTDRPTTERPRLPDRPRDNRPSTRPSDDRRTARTNRPLAA